jgi:hypothetical protein
MKMTARIRPVAEQKTASEALVLPVLAQAARLDLPLPDSVRPKDNGG